MKYHKLKLKCRNNYLYKFKIDRNVLQNHMRRSRPSLTRLLSSNLMLIRTHQTLIYLTTQMSNSNIRLRFNLNMLKCQKIQNNKVKQKNKHQMIITILIKLQLFSFMNSKTISFPAPVHSIKKIKIALTLNTNSFMKMS